jgi:hypothetical protein
LACAAFDPTTTLKSVAGGFNPTLHKGPLFDRVTCHSIERHENVRLYGPTAIGKRHATRQLAAPPKRVK